MEYAFLTTLIPPGMDERVREDSTYNMQDAANALQWHIIEGLTAQLGEKLSLFNILPIGSFPQYYSKAFIRTEKFAYGENTDNVNIGFCNIKLIRKYRQSAKAFKALDAWCGCIEGEKTLFVYTASATAIQTADRLKMKYPKLRICVIVADLPDMSSLSSRKGILMRAFIKSQAENSYARMACVDSFALLSRHMADYMKIDVPYCVMEGISTAREMPGHAVQKRDGIKRILYSGTLHRRFGVLNLVEAFSMIPDPDCRLLICGIGDGQDAILEKAKMDSRIDFRGQLTRAEVLELQGTADVLVNPRQNIEAFTKYSFPSKILEYLSSGIPTVAYKLDGIPDEYDDYINYVPDNSAEALRDKLLEVCEDANGEYSKKAAAAADFVKNEKNAVKQTGKILRMIEAL